MKKKKDTIEILKEDKVKAIDNIQTYIAENLDEEISGLQAEMFLDFITEKIGRIYYNKAIADSITFMNEKTEDLYLLMKEEK